MKTMIKSLVLLLAATPLLALGAAADGKAGQTNAARAAKPSDLFGDTIIAKGKNVSVTRGEFDEALIGIKATASARGQVIPPEQLALVEQQVLDRLIQIQLLLAKATDADKAAGKQLGEKRLTEIKARSGSEEAFERQLKSVGMTHDDLVSKITEESTAETVIKRELKADVTAEDAKKFYDENPARFEEPEMVRASHILIGTRDPAAGSDLPDDKKAEKRKLAEDLLKRARAGEDFAALAKEYSEDPGSKDKGGEYTFPRGKMVPEFEAAAFSLEPDQVSDIVTTTYGYHIIKLSEKLPAKKVEFEKVVDDLKEGLTQQELQKQLPDYLAKLRADAGVEILDEKLKARDAARPNAGPENK
jgi:peptidyl-prolyl cis-trans isomerase C